MEPENLDIESITNARRKVVEQTIEPIGIDELKSLGEKLFPWRDHPCRQTFFQFLEENSSSTFYHATTNDQFEIIYWPDKEKGIWFLPRGGVGPLQARVLGILKEITGSATSRAGLEHEAGALNMTEAARIATRIALLAAVSLTPRAWASRARTFGL